MAVPYPRFPPVGKNSAKSCAAAAASGAPSVEPLSAITNPTGRVVDPGRVSTKWRRWSPGE